ncbi:MAG: CRR6 family NdhI maturation factor [Leptolyngbyaceae bacterium]|nr:CRR6 family NdhI maturation factor [Leptolyngbyaceae bacterium]
MTITIPLDADIINSLNIAPIRSLIENLLQEQAVIAQEQQLRFTIDYPQDPDDPRELPEIPEIRLWFVRLDALYPWLLFLLDWKAGELARYTAMLVPHQFHPKEGIQFNPEALEIFVMHKVFVLLDWMQSQGIESNSRLKAMAQLWGYELDEGLFDLVRG